MVLVERAVALPRLDIQQIIMSSELNSRAEETFGIKTR